MAGTVDPGNVAALLEFLTAISGHEPDSIDVHEIVLRHETGVRQEVHLRHLIVPATGDGAPPAEKYVTPTFQIFTIKPQYF